MDILIGADPEIFVKDKETGKHVSAFNLIPGTKEEPFFVEGGAVQVDGMALEYNIAPAATRQGFVSNNKKVLKQLRKMVPNTLEFDYSPVADFDMDYIKAQPAIASALGCSPDYNAYTKQVNEKPDGDVPFRTASGHIHIGWTNGMDPMDPGHFEACCMLVKQLDYMLYVASLIWDDDRRRVNLYGRPGAFRPKHYGVEYRVLSNAWLNNDMLMNNVFSITKSAFNELMQGRRMYESYSTDSDTQQKYINSLSGMDFSRLWSSVSMPLGMNNALFNLGQEKFTNSISNKEFKPTKFNTVQSVITDELVTTGL